MRRTYAPVLVILFVLATGGSASAQATDPVAATELFRQGREALLRGDLTTACAKLEESLRLDVKVGTLLNLAECEDKLGRLAAARQHLQRAIDVAVAAGDDRLPLARERFAVLDKRVPRLTVSLPADAPADTVVMRDEASLGRASLGSALPVDPGDHTISVTASGHAKGTTRITLAEGGRATVVAELGAKTEDAPKGAAIPDTAADASPSSPMRTVGFIVGGAGVVGVSVGAVFGLFAMTKNNASKDECNANNVCKPHGKELRDDAQSAGNVSTAFFIAGGVLAAAGLVMVLVTPKETRARAARLEVTPALGSRFMGLGLKGAF
jgi:hypothetical protein